MPWFDAHTGSRVVKGCKCNGQTEYKLEGEGHMALHDLDLKA